MVGIPAESAGEALDLFAELYEELRRLAARKMADERRDHTLEPTALVHEAFVRLSVGERKWESRRQFFGAASEAMRRILVEHARHRQRLKRGGGEERPEFHESSLVAPVPDEKVLEVHEALDGLAARDSVKAEIVKLRFFAGLRHAEVATLLGMSEKTVRRHWEVAKVWLFQEIRRG